MDILTCSFSIYRKSQITGYFAYIALQICEIVRMPLQSGFTHVLLKLCYLRLFPCLGIYAKMFLHVPPGDAGMQINTVLRCTYTNLVHFAGVFAKFCMFSVV